jgi:hypothetical protein
MQFEKPSQISLKQEISAFEEQSADTSETVFIGGFPPKTTESKAFTTSVKIH